jgi:hypothetical protein
MDATSSNDYETNEVAKKISKNYMSETISKVCITHDKNSGHNTSTCIAKPKETKHEDTT